MADDEEGGEETREEDGRVVEVDGGVMFNKRMGDAPPYNSG